MEDESPIQAFQVLEQQDSIIDWIERQDTVSQIKNADHAFNLLLGEASRPKSVSGNACVRLCGFVERLSKSEHQTLREWTFSGDVIKKLFTFYVEWNESDQHRSMKLVLDLIVQLGKRNPDKEASVLIERDLLRTLVSILVGTSTKPVAKSAIKTIDHFITKKVFTLNDLRRQYISCQPRSDSSNENEIWRHFFNEIFPYMRLHFVCPTAGRFLILLYRGLRGRNDPQHPELKIEEFHQWLLAFLAEDISLLEAVKNYIFVPLFKADRAEALKFLKLMNNHEITASQPDSGMDMAALLRLAALETGKRVGLVEEPALSTELQRNDESSSLVLHEKILTSVLSHPAQDVRSLAFSLLITSPSTTRPYSSTALELLQRHLGAYFADYDAKFRMDIMGKARDMFKRVRGSICVLKRSITRARAKAQKRPAEAGKNQDSQEAPINTQPIMYHMNLVSLPEAQLVHCLGYHVQFLHWYIRFLCGELIPTASYQRHAASLKTLSTIIRMEGDASKTWETTEDQELFFDLFDKTWARALFDLVMDPFEDVRDMAAAALRGILGDKRYRRFTIESQERGDSPIHDLKGLLDRANALAKRTARADHADGAARAHQLLYKFAGEGDKRLAVLERLIEEVQVKLNIAESDLGRAVLEAPLHGDFAALRYIWQIVSEIKFGEDELESMRQVQDSVISCCERIWRAVQGILCDDSPEGHLPQELEEVDGINTKDVLSYSFRSIHESSTLMRVIILTTRNHSKQGLITPSPVSFERIGNLSFNQLSTLRHRGAFTTVSSTFATCCQQTKHLAVQTPNAMGLLDMWYKGTMDAIFSQGSTTRRSAGIPSLMTGLLSANSSHPSFEDAMEKLIEVASKEAWARETDGSKLPQVHAYNCLKDIFKNSLLTSMGNNSEKYLPRCLELAANGLRSEVWAIRNCGLILLRSLIDCLFGSHESKAMIEAGWDGKANRIPYHRYPTLPNALVNLLKSGHQMMAPTAKDTAGAESVFPALDIVRRAGPPDILREELQIHIAKYLASPVWHVREMAARTLCSCLLHEDWLLVIKQLLQKALEDETRNAQNHVHGVLLALKFVFERLSEVAPDRLKNDLPGLITTLKESKVDERYAYCPDILAAYLEVVNQISGFSLVQSIPTGDLSMSTPLSCASALLKIQRTTYDLYASHHTTTLTRNLREILLGDKNGADTTVAALELLPKLWKISSTSDATLSDLCGFYIDTCLSTNESGPQAAALQNLAPVMEHLLSKKRFDLLEPLPLQAVWKLLSLRSMSPSVSNALLRVSGCVVAVMNQMKQLSTTGLEGWGYMMASAGQDDEGFDTRFAAVESLQSFFAVTQEACTSEAHLPALIALYDALNDDDDEVRDIGSAAVQSILGQPLVPIEAANRLLVWLAENFANSAPFKAIIASRLTGSRSTAILETACKSASEQIDAALTVDDALFAVEEQNLFIDEIRETKRWVSVFETVQWDGSRPELTRLDEWLQGGMSRLHALAQQEDGPLGWASNPHVFAICSAVILASVSMVSKNHASPELRKVIQSAKGCLQLDKDTHVSGLLVEPLQKLRI